MSHGGERELLLELNDERRTFLSAVPADACSARFALWILGISAGLFVLAVPFAKAPLFPLPAFIPLYQAAMIVCDLVTAVMLLGQFRISQSRAILILAAGYVFTALMAIAHALSFPGLFTPTGLWSGPQTTAWLYFLWHAGFPLYVLTYAKLSSAPDDTTRLRGRAAMAAFMTFAAMLGMVAVLCLAATAGHDLLPVIMRGNTDDSRKVLVAAATWSFSFVALAALWRRRQRSIMDLWLMVVLCAWVFDIGLAAVFNGGRFDLGFYAGRVYGLAAASVVLVVLLWENGALYGRLLEAYAAEREVRQGLQEKTAQLVAANQELDAFSYSVSHDLRAPLRAIDGYAQMLEEDFGPALDAEGGRLLGVVRGSARKMSSLIDDLLEFSRLGRQEPVRKVFSMAQLVREAVAESPQAGEAVEWHIGELSEVAADRTLLRQVWLNLIGNAVKYSSKRAKPRVEVGAREEAAQTVYWVRDNGAGFDTRYADRLFGVFQRLHRPEEFPGTGVGLAIVQRIIARHGGQVWAEARPDEGATFYFSLPRPTSSLEENAYNLRP